MNLPYITKEKGIGGKIKEKLEYFKVDEVMLYPCSGNGEHLFINITKKNLTSKQIQKILSEKFNLQLRDIGLAGLKDKHSISSQVFSLNLKGKKIDEKEVKEKTEEKNIKFNWMKYHNNKLKPGHLLGNNFEVIISDLKLDENNKNNFKKVISEIKEKGIPNYYGKQRFGINQDNWKKGKQIIKDNFNIREKWLRKFLISSYQSYLFNNYLSERINKRLFGKILVGDIVKKHDTGGVFIVEEKNYEQEKKRFDNKEISFTCPIYGKKMKKAERLAEKLEQEILEKEKLTEKDLQKLGRGSRRIGRIFPGKLKFKLLGKGKIKLSFFLQKGSFATVLLREIMKNN